VAGWGGWAEDIAGNAIASGTGGYNHLQSPPEYDALSDYWYVPSLLSNSADADAVILFDGIGGSSGVLLQPVLQVVTANNNNWYFTSEATNCGAEPCWDDQIPTVETTPGHLILGIVKLLSGSLASGTEEWEIVTTDMTNGNATTLYGDLTGFGAFDKIYPGVLELHNLANCAGLPTSNSTQFIDTYVYQCGDGTNGGAEAYVNTTPAQPWYGEFGPGLPNCSFVVSDSSPGGQTSTLDWQY
jgi:hypothetical protein